MAGSNRGVRITARLLIYLVRIFIIVALVTVLAICAFYQTYNLANLYVLATDGMNARAASILMEEDRTELEEYFLQEFLENDANRVRVHQRYADYVIRNFEYRLDIELGSITVTPWGSTAVMTAAENMLYIDGDLPRDKQPANTDPDTQILAPDWQNSRYRIEFRKEKGRWFISKLELLELAPEQKPRNTPIGLPAATPATTPTTTPSAGVTPSPRGAPSSGSPSPPATPR